MYFLGRQKAIPHQAQERFPCLSGNACIHHVAPSLLITSSHAYVFSPCEVLHVRQHQHYSIVWSNYTRAGRIVLLSLLITESENKKAGHPLFNAYILLHFVQELITGIDLGKGR